MAFFIVPVGLIAFIALLWRIFRPSYDHLLNLKSKRLTEEQVKREYANDETLVPLLKHAEVPMEELARRGYGPVLEIARAMIGCIPQCDHYLEIWPPAFRCYNLLVPNLFNVPVHTLQFGRYRESAIAMYSSSKAAECSYCTSHTCSFALRRGVSQNTISQLNLTNDEKDVFLMAEALARNNVPADLKSRFKNKYSPSDAEWIILGAVNMGFLNKVMDSVGVELEDETYAETIGILGSNWSAGKNGHNVEIHKPAASAPPHQDGPLERPYHLRYIPGAVWLEHIWTRAYTVPSKWAKARTFLKRWGGYDWPILESVQSSRVIFAICATLRENLDTSSSVTGLKVKPALGVIFARTCGCKVLEQYMYELHVGSSPEELARAAQYADDGVVDATVGPLWQLARAISPSPAKVTRSTQDALRKAGTSPAQIIEVVTWIAVLQMMQRLIAYYEPSK